MGDNKEYNDCILHTEALRTFIMVFTGLMLCPYSLLSENWNLFTFVSLYLMQYTQTEGSEIQSELFYFGELFYP